MGNFILPDWAAPLPEPPAPDPAKLREQRIVDDTHTESALNDFLAAKQDAMFHAPDAFYRTQGEDAIHAAPVATQNLEQLRSDLLDGLGNDYQRKRLGDALDAQMQLTRGQMARHVAEQSLVWQRQTAQDRIALLTKEAAYHHNDTDLMDGLGRAAANAARAHARVGDTPLDVKTEDAAAATARSSVLSAAIQAKLDAGDPAGGAALLDRIQEQLDPVHAEPLQVRLDTLQRADAAKADASQAVSGESDRSSAEPVASVLSDAAPEAVQPGQQYAQARPPLPPSRRGTGASPEPNAEPIATMNARNFASHLEALREIEPNNRELSYTAPREWVPTARDVARVHEELLQARQRATQGAGGLQADRFRPPRSGDAASDVVVLGHFPDYVSKGQSMGAQYFSVPPEVWSRMSEAEQWAANARFLDRVATRGREIVLSTPATQARAGSFFARELEYMMGRGYTVGADGTRLLPPAMPGKTRQ